MLHLSIIPFAVFSVPSKNQKAKLGCSVTHSQGRYSVLLEIALWMLAAGFCQAAALVQCRKLYSCFGQGT